MAESSTQACLTVLGGSLSGTRFVLEEAVDNILIGSDPSCRFCLPVSGVSPIHARLWIDMSGATVYDTNSPRGLYVNDDRVNTQLPLRNGDILWLGTPGEEEVVMIQCRLPPRGAQQPAAGGDESATALPTPGSERETVFLHGRSAAAGPSPKDAEMMAEVMEVEGEPFATVEMVPADAEPPTVVGVREEPVRFASALPLPSGAPSIPFEVDIEETGTRSTPLAVRPPEPLEPPPPSPRPPEFRPPESAAVQRSADSVTPTVPPKVTPTPVPQAIRLALANSAGAARRETNSLKPAAPAVARERVPPPAARPAAASPRRPLDRTPVPISAPSAPRPAPAKSNARYALLGVAAVLVVVGVGLLALKLSQGTPPQVASVPASIPPTDPAAPATVAPPDSVATAPAAAAPTVAPTAAPTAPPQAPPVVEEVTIVKSPPPSPGMSAAPRPASPTPLGKASPPPAATAPSGEVLRGQQVAGLLGQADQALASNRHETAISLYDDALKLDPQNGPATVGKTRAQAALALARRTFTAGRTAVQTEKASKSLSGFDTDDVSVQKAPDFLGKIEFEVSPARVAPGVSYSVKIYVVNEGKKPIKVRGVAVGTTVNGSRSEQPVPSSKEIAPQQRVMLGEVGGEWKDGTSAWALDAQVTANKGDSLKNSLVWK